MDVLTEEEYYRLTEEEYYRALDALERSDPPTVVMSKPENTYTFKLGHDWAEGSEREFVVHEQTGAAIPYSSYKLGIESHRSKFPAYDHLYKFFEDYFALGKAGRNKLHAEWSGAQKKEDNMGAAKPTYVLAETSTYVLLSNGNITYKDNKKEEAMSTPELLDDKRREYLERRLRSIAHDKKIELKKPFNIDLNERPTSAKEFIQKVKDGQYVIPKSFLEEDSENWSYFDFYDFVHSIEWRDPSLKPDRKGYEAACKKLNEASDKVRDIIMVKSPEEGLKALEEFEAKTFH